MSVVLRTIKLNQSVVRRVWFRLSATSGDFSSRENRVLYTPAAEGKQALEVVAVNENLGVAVQTLELEV